MNVFMTCIGSTKSAEIRSEISTHKHVQEAQNQLKMEVIETVQEALKHLIEAFRNTFRGHYFMNGTVI